MAHRRRATDERARSLEHLLVAKEIAVVCGSGGVGKTTTAAAAAAMAAASFGGKVLVLTIDPARRLANALGLEGFGNLEKPVPADVFKQAGIEPRGELWAAMLDTKESWDALVRLHMPDEASAEKILDNSLYENFSSRFVQSHDYIAMERLYEIHTAGDYDLIVVDTPPTRNAIDFLEAPEHMADFFSSRFLRWITAPARSRVINFATRPFYQIADRILGTQFLQDISEFFLNFQPMYDGFVERARAVDRLLHDRRTTFIVVSTLEDVPLREAEFFIEALSESKFQLGALVLNKVLPDYLLDPEATNVAHRMCNDAPEVAHAVESAVTKSQLVPNVLREIGESFLNFQVVAKREREQRAELARVPDVVATVPYFETDIYDMGGLLDLGFQIWGKQ